jgi:hypothetical protein
MSESKFVLLISLNAYKIYISKAFPTLLNTDGLDCTIQNILKKFVAFPARIFMKHTNIQQHHVQISYTEFHPYLIEYVESTNRN